MEEKHQLLELYKEFIYTKENFINRSFATNKFYIVALTLCLFANVALMEYANARNSITISAISLAGMFFSLLLWANQDAYAYLIKIKFNNVIDKMEEYFAFKPCVEEKNAIIEQAKNKKNFLFADVQKTYALIAMALFLATFLWELIPLIISNYIPIV